MRDSTACEDALYGDLPSWLRAIRYGLYFQFYLCFHAGGPQNYNNINKHILLRIYQVRKCCKCNVRFLLRGIHGVQYVGFTVGARGGSGLEGVLSAAPTVLLDGWAPLAPGCLCACVPPLPPPSSWIE